MVRDRRSGPGGDQSGHYRPLIYTTMADSCDSLENVRYATPELALDWKYEGDLHNSVFPIQCPKDPRHSAFIPVKDIDKEQLPKHLADNDIIDLLKALADLTVRIRVKTISDERPAIFEGTNIPYPFHIPGGGELSRAGSGFVNVGCNPDRGESLVRHHQGQGQEGEPCDCSADCQQSGEPRFDWWDITIITALHVLYDKKECLGATVDFFYDDDADKSGMVSLQGTWCPSMVNPLIAYDRAIFGCRTHNEQLVQRLEESWRKAYYNLGGQIQLKYGFQHIPKKEDPESDGNAPPDLPKLNVVVISHPHGCRKYVTVGTTGPDWMQKGCVKYTTKTCPGSSGGLVCVFGAELLYTFSPHAQALPCGHNQSGITSAGRRNPRFW